MPENAESHLLYPFLICKYGGIATVLFFVIHSVVTIDIRFSRFLHLCKPMQCKKMNTRKNAKMAVTGMCVFLLAASLPGICEFYAQWIETENGTIKVVEKRRLYAESPTYDLGYNVIFFTLIYDVIPMFFIIIPFNIAVLKALRRMGTRENSTRLGRTDTGKIGRRNRNKNSTVLILSMVLVFILLRLPGSFGSMIEPLRMIQSDFMAGFNRYKLVDVTNFLLDLNSAVNFVIYISVGKSFRETLKIMCIQCTAEKCGRVEIRNITANQENSVNVTISSVSTEIQTTPLAEEADIPQHPVC